MASLAAALLCLCAPACARADWPLSARALTASAAPHALPLRLRLRPRAHRRCETAGRARGAAAPSIGVKGLLPRAPWWWKRHRERAHGALWQTLPPRPPKQRCARTQLSRASIIGRLSLVVYPTGTAFSRYERTLPAPCSMPIRTHNIGVYSYHRHAGAVAGHTYAVLDLPSALRQCALS